MLKWLLGSKKPSLPRNFKDLVDRDAQEIVAKLKQAGYESYLVGGCVRDLILKIPPKDFDVATSALPQKVKNVVHRSFIIGRRFRIVVAKRRVRGNEAKESSHPLFPTYHQNRAVAEKEFQITTFRREPEVIDEKINENVFGTAKDDALRRDFTINGLFLEPASGKIIDFVGGLEDIERKQLRVIGEPAARFAEDPIRILRALRFAARADFVVEKRSLSALRASVHHLGQAKKERIREDVLKILKEGTAERCFREFAQYGIWQQINPTWHEFLAKNAAAAKAFQSICRALSDADWHAGIGASPLFFLFLYPVVEAEASKRQRLFDAVADDLKISKAEKEEMSRVWALLNRLRSGKRKEGVLVPNPRFYASQVQAFFALSVLSKAGLAPWNSIWPEWKSDWIDHARKSKGHAARVSHAAGGSENPRAESGSSTPRRRRRRSGRRASSGGGPASTPSTTPTT
jgi:poly(A) polymerase